MPRKINQYFWYYFALLGLTLVGCYPTRSLEKGEYLLKANTVFIDSTCAVKNSDLESIIKQKPNKDITLPIYIPGKIWGWDVTFLRLNLRAYNLGGKGKSRLGKWLRLKVGEAPVIYDSSEAERTQKQMKEYLFQRGYFNAIVDTVPTYRPKKKMIKMAYVVHPKMPYTIKSIKANIRDISIREVYYRDSAKTFLKTGDIYNYENLEKERQRLVTLFKNNGYYAFTRDFIRFDVDSALLNRQLILMLNIKDFPFQENITADSTSHIKYYPRYYYVYPQYDFFKKTTFSDTIYKDNIRIVYNKKLNINPKLLYNNLLFRDNYYEQNYVDETYRSLSSLNIYKNISIEYKYLDGANNLDKIDSYIYLTPAKRNSFSVEARLETRANNGSNNTDQKGNYNFGVSGNLTYQKRNAFKNGEILKISFSGGLEPFFLSDSTSSKNFFNTVEFGPTVSVTFPRFLLPISQDKFAKSARAKTIISAAYNTLQNDDLSRRAIRLVFGYEWTETATKRHQINPAELSLVNARLSSFLDTRLQQIGDPFLRNTYSNQFILASSYTFTYSNQYTPKSQKAIYNRSKIEGAGNLLRLLSPSLNINSQNGSYELFNSPFAQYLKVENEFKTYTKSFFQNTLAFRLLTALAKPLENSGSLPFEKSYFAGGSNGIRAWGARSLGPGGYLDTINFTGFINRIGEIHLESNLEYRLQPIDFFFTKLEFALFADVGNIWVFKETGNRSNTEFGSKFYKQLALGGGIGARLDFDFFLLRFDFGLPLHDPSLPDGERWFYQKKETYNQIVDRYNERKISNNRIASYRLKANFNVGVGYPF